MESYNICVIYRVTTKLLHMYLSMANLGIADSVEAYLSELIKTWCSSMFSSQNPHILKVRDLAVDGQLWIDVGFVCMSIWQNLMYRIKS